MDSETLIEKGANKNKKIKILLTIVILAVIIAIGLFQHTRTNKLKITKLKVNNEQFNSASSELVEKVNKSYIYVDDYKQESDIDDTLSIQRAIDAANSSTYKPIVMLSQKTYITSSPITLPSYVVLCGGYANDEYKYKATIKNVTTDIFTISDTTTIGYNLISICFEGNLNNQLFVQQDSATYFHKWGKILHCGFKSFKSAFGEIQFVGFRIYDCFFNSIYQIGTIYGSDNYFQQWFVGHYHDNVLRYDFSLVLKCPLTIVRDIFWTGDLDVGYGPYSLLNIFGSSTYGVRVENCTFDYCDGAAIVCNVQSRQIIIDGNTFRGNLRNNKSVNYTGIISLHTAQNVTICNNTFSHVNQGVENLTPKFYCFNGNTGYEARHIDIFGNHYEEDYIFAIDDIVSENINIKDVGISFNNPKALTISIETATPNVDYIDEVLNTYANNYSITNFTGNLYDGKEVTIYNFVSSTITFVQGNFRNKSGTNLTVNGYASVRYVYRSGKWWEV